MKQNKELQPVKRFLVKCSKWNDEPPFIQEYEYDVLATNSDNALSMISRQTDWDEIQVHRTSDVIGWAEYSARNISNDDNLYFSLHYHCKPVGKGLDVK